MSVLGRALSASERSALTAAELGAGPFLAYRAEQGRLRIVPLTRDLIRIGRTSDNDVVVAGDVEVSRLHAQLMAAGEGWTLVDDGTSRNGTYVNGERVVRHRRLADGDTIRVGSTAILFRHPAAVGAVSTAVTVAMPPPRVTDAERRVLVALCRPLLEPGVVSAPATNGDIATELVLSVAGVKSHVHSLFVKFAVDSRTGLARRALDLGVVTARDRQRQG